MYILKLLAIGQMEINFISEAFASQPQKQPFY